VLEQTLTPSKYFLSSTACAGILRRAEKRGKKLPAQLAAALQAVVDSAPILSAPVAYKPLAEVISENALPENQRGGLNLDYETADFIYGIPGNLNGRKPENGGNATTAMDNISPCMTGTDRHGVAFAHTETMPTLRAGAQNGGAGHGARSGDSKDEYIVPVSFTPFDIAGTMEACEHSGGWGNSIDKAAGSYMCLQADRTLIGAFKGGQGAKAGGIAFDVNISPTLSAADSGSNRTPCIAFDSRQDCVSSTDVFGSLSSALPQSQAVVDSMQVRRFTPVECERLQGFPDGYTDVPHRNKPAADGNRYKALGNSMAVPVMKWLGERIDKFTTAKDLFS
jgi:site-specific DNA-cytosine methylase